MAVVEFQLSKTMIDWIADSRGISTETLAEQLMPTKTDKFFNGIVTKTAAEKLAKIGRIPFGYLFLNTPPSAPKPLIPDLRQSVGASALGKDFFDIYYDIEYKLEWYKEYLKDNGNDTKIPFIGSFKFDRNLSHELVASNIAKCINFDFSHEIKNATIESYFTKAAKLIEDVGILVFKNGVVGNNTSRKLDTNEFRGFCIPDDIAPIVFVNGSDALSAQVFTLFHEVAHLWIGVGGVSGWDDSRSVEAFCNRVAAEILMPKNAFFEEWKKVVSDDDLLSIKQVSAAFKMSNFACAIRAIQLNLIDGGALELVKREAYGKIATKSSGGSFFNTLPVRNSPKLTGLIISSAMSQRIPLREAGALLNVKADTVVDYYKKRESL